AHRQREVGGWLQGVPCRVPHASSPQSVRVRRVLGLGSPPGRVERRWADDPYNFQCFQVLLTSGVPVWVTDCDTRTPGGVTDCDRTPWRAPPATRLRDAVAAAWRVSRVSPVAPGRSQARLITVSRPWGRSRPGCTASPASHPP